jgi:hypothetical protein
MVKGLLLFDEWHLRKEVLTGTPAGEQNTARK